MPQSQIPEPFKCPNCGLDEAAFHVQTQMWSSSHNLVDQMFDLASNARWECDECSCSGPLDRDGPLFDELGEYPEMSREARKARTVPHDPMGLRAAAHALLDRYRKVFELIDVSIMRTRINTASSISELMDIISEIKAAVLKAEKDLDAEEFDPRQLEPDIDDFPRYD